MGATTHRARSLRWSSSPGVGREEVLYATTPRKRKTLKSTPIATFTNSCGEPYYQSLDGEEPVAITSEGSGGYPSLITLSPDGAYLVAAAPATESYAMYPVHGGQSRTIPGLSTSEAVINWSADGKYLFTYTRGEVPARIYRVEITSGRRELFKVTSPPDLAGVEDVTNLCITRDGRSYAYTCPTVLSELYVVDGLR